MYTAFYSFLKQAKLWETQFGLPQPDPEAALAGETADGQILSFPQEAAREQKRRAA